MKKETTADKHKQNAKRKAAEVKAALPKGEEHKPKEEDTPEGLNTNEIIQSFLNKLSPAPHITKELASSLRNLQRRVEMLMNELIPKDGQKQSEALAARAEQRKAIPKTYNIDEALKTENPEILAAAMIWDYEHIDDRDENPRIPPTIRKTLVHSFTDKAKKDIFVGYLSLYENFTRSAECIDKSYKRYKMCTPLIARLLEKYESIERDKIIFDILFQCVTMGGGHTGIKYALHTDATEPKKSLDETTPEELLAEMNEIHKGNGVIFKDGGQGELITDIDEGGLYNMIKEQVFPCLMFMLTMKAEIEVIEKFISEYAYELFVPSCVYALIDEIKHEKYTRQFIAPEYHRSEINRRKREGLPVTPEEERMAVIPDYEELNVETFTNQQQMFAKQFNMIWKR